MEQLDILSVADEVSMEAKHFDRDDVVAAWERARDPDTPDRKRKSSDDRQPESPPEIERKHAPESWHREKSFRSATDPMDTDSPASYPKHLMNSDQVDVDIGGASNGIRYHREANDATAKLSTPILGPDEDQSDNLHGDPYETPSYRPTSSSNGHYSHGSYHHEGSFQGHTPPSNTGGHYLPDMETSPAHYVTPQQPDVPMRPRRWACDYCNVATFISYEEACSHEEACAQKYYERYGSVHPSRGPVPQYDIQAGQQQLGSPDPAPANQKYGSSSIPGHQYGMVFEGHHHPSYQYGGYHGHHHQYHHGYQYPPHVGSHQQHHHYNHPYHQHHRYGGYHHSHGAYNKPSQAPRRDAYPTPVVQTNSDGEAQKCMSLALPTDNESLSDRQLFVRAEMIELFAATEKDVTARHSKGAQKLVEGQVGIRCRYCKHLRPRDRSERAVCYPSSISRIYQTVADMQRFHFEQCKQIPAGVARHYKSLKTTRPRGTGSPQTYWIQSAKLLGLVDTSNGIRLAPDLEAEEEAKQAAAAAAAAAESEEPEKQEDTTPTAETTSS